MRAYLGMGSYRGRRGYYMACPSPSSMGGAATLASKILSFRLSVGTWPTALVGLCLLYTARVLDFFACLLLPESVSSTQVLPPVEYLSSRVALFCRFVSVEGHSLFIQHSLQTSIKKKTASKLRQHGDHAPDPRSASRLSLSIASLSVLESLLDLFRRVSETSLQHRRRSHRA